ncbi:MAG: putative baseplate assembly protein [Anaerolineaceae bacterium]|jgi:predicted phage baseplate assembly protein
MSLPIPSLDDRRFQDFVDEAKRLIPRYCPDWTDHNVSDPGITLIELFAWMTEQFIFRLNQVPDKNMLTFLNLIGAKLEPAQPARGDITFTLSAPPLPDRRIIIPIHTEVATVRTETEEAVVFTTDEEVEVRLPGLRWLMVSLDGQEYLDHTQALNEDSPFDIWESSPKAGQAVYFGFDQDLSAHTLALSVECEKHGIGIDPNNPPWQWQVWRGNEFGWQVVSIVSDKTAGFNQNGDLLVALPYRCQPNQLQLREAATWLRVMPLEKLPPGTEPYRQTPRLRRVSAYTIGITVPVTHALAVGPEVLGTSNGQPAQKFHLINRNILKPEGPYEVVEVSPDRNEWEAWQQVPDFGNSTPADWHYVLDPISGEVEFGPAIRQRNGTEPQFGAIPPNGSIIRMRGYRVGGGVRGNVGAGSVRVLKSTLSYVSSVINRSPITGGLEAQSLEDARLRSPALLRTRYRAVTADDYEFLAGQIEGVGRVRCLQPQPDASAAAGAVLIAPNTVMLLVIPSQPPLEGDEMDRHIDLHETLAVQERRPAVEASLKDLLALTPSTVVRLRDHLDSRRLLTTRLEIQQPQYVWVTVQTRIKTLPKAEPERVRYAVKAALYRFLHPVFGGPDGTGWPFGRVLTIDKVYALIQTVPGVEYATELNLYPIDMNDANGQRLGKSSQVINVPNNGVIVSYFHNVYLAR